MVCLPLGGYDCLILDVYRADLHVVASLSSVIYGYFCNGVGSGEGPGKNYSTKMEVREPIHPTSQYQIACSWVPRELG